MSQTDRNGNLHGEIYKGGAAGESGVRTLFIQEKWIKWGTDEGRSMRDRRGSGPALLNVPAFMRAVKLSM